ncbi:MAG TPA: hypothetical protein VIV40_28850, partial [Kofleriaceae bacterium]
MPAVSSSSPASAGRGGRSPIVLALVCGWIAFAYRFPDVYFHNDHFEHLSMARQMLFGELPGRDFFEPGRPLTVALSALGQWLSPTLLSEALLTVGGLAVGAALTGWVACTLSGSLLAGALAGWLVIAIAPRLYAYPKVLVFAVALWAIRRYVETPSTRRLLSLSVVALFAFLMRHDFVVYVGVATLTAVVARHGWHSVRPLVIYAGVALIAAAPYLAWQAVQGRLVRDGSSGAAAMLAIPAIWLEPVHLDWSAGVLRLRPREPNVAIRWRAGVPAGDRGELEDRHGLVQAQPAGDLVFRYRLADESHSNIAALLAEPMIEDTAGIDRHAGALEGSPVTRWAERIGLTRLEWAPLFDRVAAEAWLYDLCVLLPLCALVGSWFERDASPRSTLLAAAVMGLLADLYLIRGSLDSRIPDVVVPAAVCGAWCVTAAVRAASRRSRALVAVPAVAIVALMLLTWISLTVHEPGTAFAKVGASVSWARLQAEWRALDGPPAETALAAADPEAGMIEYLRACTEADDRVLIVGYQPQVFYYAGRRFAGGMPYFIQRRFSSAADQTSIVEKLKAQRVPLVLVEESLHMLDEDYPRVAAYVRSRYVEAGAS